MNLIIYLLNIYFYIFYTNAIIFFSEIVVKVMYYVPKNNKLEENGLRYGMFYSSYIYIKLQLVHIYQY